MTKQALRTVTPATSLVTDIRGLTQESRSNLVASVNAELTMLY
jgi:hypothetical protein